MRTITKRNYDVNGQIALEARYNWYLRDAIDRRDIPSFKALAADYINEQMTMIGEYFNVPDMTALSIDKVIELMNESDSIPFGQLMSD